MRLLRRMAAPIKSKSMLQAKKWLAVNPDVVIGMGVFCQWSGGVAKPRLAKQPCKCAWQKCGISGITQPNITRAYWRVPDWLCAHFSAQRSCEYPQANKYHGSVNLCVRPFVSLPTKTRFLCHAHSDVRSLGGAIMEQNWPLAIGLKQPMLQIPRIKAEGNLSGLESVIQHI